MTDEQTQAKPLEEFSRKELNAIADELGVSKAGKNEEVIARIREANQEPVEQQDPVEEDVVEDEPLEEEVEEETTPVVRRSTPRDAKNAYDSTMQAINVILSTNPDVLTIIRVKKRSFSDAGDEIVLNGYTWADKTKDARVVREKIRKQLKFAWQAAALNYDMITRSLRVGDLSVKGLLDEEFIEANGL